MRCSSVKQQTMKERTNDMARTIVEAAKEKMMAKLPHDKYAEVIANNPEELDLTLLPTETSMKLCVTEYDAFSNTMSVVDDTRVVDALSMGQASYLGNTVTLRQAKFVEVKPSNSNVTTFTREPAVELNLPIKGSSRKQKILMFNNGMSVHVLASVVENALTALQSGTYNAQKYMENINEDGVRNRMAFLGQHTIKFPPQFKGRDQVTFLGLPKGTIIPASNGGIFEVERRMNIEINANNNQVTGMLALKMNNHEAVVMAQKFGWQMTVIEGRACAMVPSNLLTGNTRHRFLLEGVRVPYKDVFARYDAFLNFGRVELDGSFGLTGGAMNTPAGKMVYHSSQDALADELDKFFFGG